MNDYENELLDLTSELLQCIAEKDWETYVRLCDPSLTAFEPESLGQRVEGLSFHQFYFELDSSTGLSQTTIVDPHVRIMGNVAVVSYPRLEQRVDSSEQPLSLKFQETRVWQRVDGEWLHVHFHRSAL